MTATSTQESTALAVAQPQGFDLSPRNFEEAWRLSDIMANSDMVPKDFKGKPENCLIAIQWGAELGLKSMQAIQNIAVINGRPALWGDVMLALVRNSPLCEYVQEGWLPDGTAFCRAKRRGEPVQERTFSDADAKQAGLLAKAGPWTTGPKRMKQMRARAWALRDVFTDVLRGLSMAEEAMDMPPIEKHMGPVDVVDPRPASSQDAPTEEWPANLFAQRLPEWHKAIQDKKATVDAIVAKARTKYPLSPEQEKQIREVPKANTAGATDAEPKLTFAHVADAIAKASDLDALATAGDLIKSVPDEQHRTELQAKYDARELELKD